MYFRWFWEDFFCGVLGKILGFWGFRVWGLGVWGFRGFWGFGLQKAFGV